jgi:hypothetical protein
MPISPMRWDEGRINNVAQGGSTKLAQVRGGAGYIAKVASASLLYASY